MKLIKYKTLFLPLILSLTTLVYWRGVNGNFFLFDDFINIVFAPTFSSSPNLSWDKLSEVWQSGFSGPLGRGVALVSFYIDYFLSGTLDPIRFKATNLGIHLANTILIYCLAKKILTLGSKQQNPSNVWLLAALITSIWSFHPINLTNVLYIVQRMNSLSGTFTLITILAYIELRCGNHKIVAAFTATLAFILGMLTKETALSTILYLPLVEIYILQFRKKPDFSEVSICIKNTYIALVIIGITLSSLYLIKSIDELNTTYNSLRDFTLQERLLTQPRVIIWYAFQIIAPNINSLSLFHDDWRISSSLLSPISTLLSISALLLVSIFCTVKALQRQSDSNKIVYFGITWYIAGHLLEGSIWPLEMVFEHRNYIPSFGLILSGCLLMTNSRVNPQIGALIAVIFTMYCLFTTFIRSSYWSDYLYLSQHQYKNYPNSKRASTEYGNALMIIYSNTKNETDYQNAKSIYKKIADRDDSIPHDVINFIRVSSIKKNSTDSKYIELAKYKLQNNKNYPSNYAAAVSLIKSINEGKSTISKKQLVEILNGYTKNRYHTHKTLSDAYGLLAIAHGIDPPHWKAVEASLLAANHSKQTLTTLLNLSKFYAEHGKKEQALLYFKQAQKISSSEIKLRLIDANKKIVEIQ